MDYKELFQEFFDEAIEEGLTEEAAGIRADEMLSDHYLSMGDNRDE